MLSEIYSAILKNGLRTYKYRNSTMKPAGHIDSSRSGAIFAYRSKQLMNVGRGMVI
ncbi:TPA: replication protein RepR, partial [Enterococcus faecium]